jgi:molecular chaperone GrpE
MENQFNQGNEEHEELNELHSNSPDEDLEQDDNNDLDEGDQKNNSSSLNFEKQAVEYKEKYFYLAAEMQNLQRRFDKEKDQVAKYGAEKIISEMVDVIDNFERTLSFIKMDEDPKVKNIVVGIEMINKQFLQMLEKHGLKVVNALGEIFDPNLHEALSQVEDKEKKNMEIIQVHQNGYTLHDRLLRPAKVVVAKN